MLPENLLRTVYTQLPYRPNEQQAAVSEVIARFCSELDTPLEQASLSPTEDRAFVINGYAGTGKTSLISAFVKALNALNVNVVLMAPTGRAAKVFSSYSGFPASTIHRKIYRHSLHGEVPPLKENKDSNTLYIVDEASMIASGGDRGSNLLIDLLTYVYAGTNNRLILMGDTAQLPPVGDIESPAMDKNELKNLGLKVSSATLTRVVRQGVRSGILANAVNIRREMIERPTHVPVPIVNGFNDVHTVTAEDLPEVIDSAYRTVGIDDTIIITRSNKRAADFNRAIRNQVFYYEEELVKGESIMIVKNNYYWTRKAKRKDPDFLANGDIVRITRIISTETRYGFRFADVEIVPVDWQDGTAEIEPLQVKIFLDTLDSDYPNLPSDRMQQLFERMVRKDYAECSDPQRALAEDPYWNALQAKYAYCVTCHKAQGGQWSQVIVDIAYINPEAVGPELYRWMYTATTRARHTLTYLTDRESYT